VDTSTIRGTVTFWNPIKKLLFHRVKTLDETGAYVVGAEGLEPPTFAV
jgi:hypothetical protein